ncbi:hypothetical protein [Mycobacterium mantenii]|uniref:hypothetical protein n=1 Tax=Mycobacterium mantenii TaxID=560555 RepID=UPI000AD34079|nr:hypothetical protein [Mycobacterium mantenii]
MTDRQGAKYTKVLVEVRLRRRVVRTGDREAIDDGAAALLALYADKLGAPRSECLAPAQQPRNERKLRNHIGAQHFSATVAPDGGTGPINRPKSMPVVIGLGEESHVVFATRSPALLVF